MSKRIKLTVCIIAMLSMVAFCGACYASTSVVEKKPVKPPLNPLLKIEMISIPAGTFLMGTPDNFTADHNEVEHPQHSVTLGAYSIGKYEVTRGQYKQFIDAGGYSKEAYWSTEGWKRQSQKKYTEPAFWAAAQDWDTPKNIFNQTDNHPVVGISYYEAEAFCNWAGGHLPTEAQWERAASWTGTHANIYPWGDTWAVQKCNNWDDTVCPRYQTSLVGSYKSGASPSGCMDMAGNVNEWCKDWYDAKYYSQSPKSDPQGPASGSDHVLRGGGWYRLPASNYRCASRLCDNPYYANNDYGFRLAR